VVVAWQATQNHQDNPQFPVTVSVARVASLQRTSNTVALTWSAPYTTPALNPGDGIWITSCPADPSFVGRWRVATVPDTSHLTFTQVGPDTGLVNAGTIVAVNVSLAPDVAVSSAVRTATPATVTATGSVTAGSNVITGITTTGIQAGAVSGWSNISSAAMWADLDLVAFPPDTRVVGVNLDGPNTVRVSQNAKPNTTGSHPLQFGFPWDGQATTSVTLASAYTAGPYSVLFQVGAGISLFNLADHTFSNTSTNRDTFIILSINSEHMTISFAQADSAATLTPGANDKARWAMPTATWAAALRGGGFCNPGNGQVFWAGCYVEVGQSNQFTAANLLDAPVFGSGPNDYTQLPGGVPVTQPTYPTYVYGNDPVYGNWPYLPCVSAVNAVQGWVFNRPANVISQYDVDQGNIIRLGTTWCRSMTTEYQDPTNNNTDVWTDLHSLTKRALQSGAWGSQKDRLALNAPGSGGATAPNSEGTGAVRVNADAGTGSGGLVVGDGTGALSTTILVGYTRPTPIPDSAAPGGSYYLGSDHGGALCRKDATAVTHVVAEVLSGASSSRPAAAALGTAYFDTTLGKPVWYNGTNWVNSSGVTS
jgi:hypothetical protein